MQIRIYVYALLLGGLLAILAVFMAERRLVSDSVQWLRLHRLFCGGVAAFLSGTAVAQRRSLTRVQFPRSWLAVVPVKPSMARWEAFLLDTLPVSIAMSALLLLAILTAIAGAFAPDAQSIAILGLWVYVCAAMAIGVGMSYLLPRPSPVDLPPGSRYVPKPRVNRAAPIRPSFASLGVWPIRQIFAWAQPKVVARATIPLLVMMPLGTTADTAMIAIAMFAVLFAMSLLWGAVISVSRAARRWLAPLPLHQMTVIRTVLIPVCCAIAGASAAESLLLSILNVSYGVSVKVGVVTAVIGCLTIGAALLWNLRPRLRS
jgi:hypothetical protein